MGGNAAGKMTPRSLFEFLPMGCTLTAGTYAKATHGQWQEVEDITGHRLTVYQDDCSMTIPEDAIKLNAKALLLRAACLIEMKKQKQKQKDVPEVKEHQKKPRTEKQRKKMERMKKKENKRNTVIVVSCKV